MKCTIELNNNDELRYYFFKDGKAHRLHGPAIEFANGDKYWYQNDRLHRLDGPAIERADGTNSWHQNGKRIR